MPDDEQMRLPFPPQIVKKSNVLCRARWSAESILEPRIIALVASKVNPDDEDSTTYDIPVSELLGKNYAGKRLDDLEAAAHKLVGRTVKLKVTGGWDICPLVSKCSFREKTGFFTVTLDPVIRPHFLWFKENVLKIQYARYDLLEFMSLPSIYSQRIFELLKSWDDKPEFLVSIDDLHEMLATPKTYRKDFKEFRTRVLERAHKDIHKYTSMRYKWTAIKDGRRIGAIQFRFTGRRFAESKVEDARKEQGKALAKSRKRTAAFREAAACAKEKNGVCTLRDRAKRVCDVCAECEMLREFAIVTGQPETSTNQ